MSAPGKLQQYHMWDQPGQPRAGRWGPKAISQAKADMNPGGPGTTNHMNPFSLALFLHMLTALAHIFHVFSFISCC